MPEQVTHPSQEELSAFNLGQLPLEKAVIIENHINDCRDCCETLVGLSSDDTFVALLQQAKQLPANPLGDHESLKAKGNQTQQDIPLPLVDHPRYEIVGHIGKGGMGDVFKARHRMMDRMVAIKMINRELVRHPEAVNRFKREVKSAAQLSHPNVVTAYDAEQMGNEHFLVMEYVTGVDLSQLVKDQGPIPVIKACDYIRQAAIGLQHAHERGLVHRDIKPHNLMVTADGTVKILDFGLASLAPEILSEHNQVDGSGDLTATGATMGTPDFISPEQAENAHQADVRSDIYSLGATHYFLLAGLPPFAGGSVKDKLKSHAKMEPDRLETLRSDIPDGLSAVVSKMIAKDPKDRYQTPAEVALALMPFSPASRSNIKEFPFRKDQPLATRTFLLPYLVVPLWIGGLLYNIVSLIWRKDVSEMELSAILGQTLWVVIDFGTFISWMRNGVWVPLYIHAIALAGTCIGLGCLIALIAIGALTFSFALGLVGLPPVLTYFFWLRMSGMEISEKPNE